MRKKSLTSTQVQENQAEMLETLLACLLIAGIVYLLWLSY